MHQHQIKCSHAECDDVIGHHGARGLCSKHYRQLVRSGEPVPPPVKRERFKPGPSADGKVRPSQHPRYAYWRRTVRMGRLCDRWATSFPLYLAECAPPPSDFCRVEPIHGSKAGPLNYKWVEIMTEEERAVVRPKNFRKSSLQKKYNLTPECYEKMHSEQNGCCAICKKPEDSAYKGKLRQLAVDHCHTTGRVRQLLCFKCNTAVGRFGDNPAILRAAAEHIERYQT